MTCVLLGSAERHRFPESSANTRTYGWRAGPTRSRRRRQARRTDTARNRVMRRLAAVRASTRSRCRRTEPGVPTHRPHSARVTGVAYEVEVRPNGTRDWLAKY